MSNDQLNQYVFERKLLIGVCMIALLRSMYSMYQLYMGVIDTGNLVGQSVLFTVYLGTLIYVWVIGYRKGVAMFFGVVFSLANSYLWLVNGGVTGVVETGMVASVIVGAIITSGRHHVYIVVFTLVCLLVAIYLWEFQQDLISIIIGDQGNSIFKYQILVVLVTIGMVYFSFQHNAERKDQWEIKNVLHKKMAEIRKENVKLIEQEKELLALNQSLTQNVQNRKEQLNRQNNAIEQYLELTSMQISPSVDEMNNQIMRSNFEGEYGKLLKKSGTSLVKSLLRIQGKKDKKE
ncbi:hypothetical protein [Reichenbachiella sp. MSK19-1]|uniref:hypothetical protein n=1 Tax=Reichenbachiella sp. MSK19-1 TaxID=1897631 RepID=UPI0011C42E95|nr:hypothetical protein [Reichenbachiella sp. MSK19-1]